MAKMNSLRVLLLLAVNLVQPLHQFDVKNVFPHGDLEEEVYKEIPPGLKFLLVIGKVCTVKKCII